MALTFSHFIRIGEAAVPGPPCHEHPDSYMDPIPWSLQGPPEFCLGTCNPSGISNKHHVFEHFPIGWWHVTETQATKSQQCGFQSFLRSVSYRSGRRLRSCLGAPAPLRMGSSACGTWTGVLSFGDCPIRSVPGIWPLGEFESGRVVLSQAFVGGLEIGAATVYCPPKGPSYPQARDLCERMLESVTEQLVCGRQGPRMVLGDFNNHPGSLDIMKAWQALGFVELQTFMQATHGIIPKPTCKGASFSDQIWCSPELLPFITNSTVWSILPDHAVLAAGISVPQARIFDFQWPLPGHLPWDHIDKQVWEAVPPGASLVDLVCSSSPPSVDLPDGVSTEARVRSSAAFSQWSANFEQAVSDALPSHLLRHDTSTRGRGRLCRPVKRRVHARVPKSSRPGELVQACGFLNRSVTRWFQQLRRLQSYGHAIRSPRAPETFLSRAALWHSILAAPGFVEGFSSWWRLRPVQSQGAPLDFPRHPPDQPLFEIIFADYQANYRRYEHWQLTKRRDSSHSKLLASQKRIFAPTRQEPKLPLETIEDTISQSITVVDGRRGLVSVPSPFPTAGVLRWTLQDQPAWVLPEGPYYQVDSDLLLCSNQRLTCVKVTHDPSEIHQRLISLWSPRWNRHADVPLEAWQDIVSSVDLPSDVFSLPPLSVQDWRRAVNGRQLQRVHVDGHEQTWLSFVTIRFRMSWTSLKASKVAWNGHVNGLRD